MKIDRLLGIITVLQQREKVTAPELAERFEVSRRTIQRDVEAICKAGIPVITYQGGDGGIALAEGYKLDKRVMSVSELQNIISGLKSIGSVSDSKDIARLIDKLSPAEKGTTGEKVAIDLASHYRSSLSEKITLFKTAIAEHKLVKFDYYSKKGVKSRIIEPYLVTYKWASWYVYGYCTEKQAYRLFKLNRLWEPVITGTPYEPRGVRLEEIELDSYFQDNTVLIAIFEKDVKFLLVEEYGPACFAEDPQGKLKLTIGFTDREYMLRWLLSFGDKVEVMAPLEIREKIIETAKNTLSIYEHDI
ncbi:HTH domain protein [Ruminiclostridium hungatei]|uniref:HTH domain protein n=1 Tax=Ruminiclostridium hungatei TaxID=48256 RepID=A0A1V4SJW7_RUMHU|nr:YafY family protein [Ruminiclostridium hungatei]OPX44199.1 HTH domain protein [Ruminiclostridium hungatei]